MKHNLRPYLAITAGLVATAFLAGCSQAPVHEVHGPAPTSSAHAIAPQVHRNWFFASDGVTFSNQLDGARLNGVERLARNRYQVTIAPESLPINPSPWYGFSVRSAQARHLTIHFRYLHGKQRYTPHLSRDRRHWRIASESEFTADEAGGSTLRVNSNTKPLQVFAQIPVGEDEYAHWQARLAEKITLNEMNIGRSVEGRPMRAFTFGNPNSGRLLVVIGRQHPPETTGTIALMKFVDTLAGDQAQVRSFRDQVLTLVIPLLNPDGVASGNWRGNAHGQDLNRDWGPFHEPETRAGRDAINELLSHNGRSLALAIDFHSTWKDIFYIVEEDPATAPGGLLQQLIEQMRAAFPGQIRVKANAAKGSVFKNWIFRHYHAPAVTYEVGDQSAADEVDRHASFAASTLMNLLTDKHHQQSGQHAENH